MKTSIRQTILAELKAARDIADGAEAAARDLTEEERGRVTAHLQKASELKRGADEADALRKSLSDLTDGIGMVSSEQRGGEGDQPGEYRRVKRGGSVGRLFVESAEYKSLVASAPQGRFSEKARVQSQPFGVKALITGLADDSAGALIDAQQYVTPAEQMVQQRPLTVRQLFSQGQTETDSIEYVRVLAQTNNAAVVPEATSTAVIGDGTGGTVTAAAGGLKPESGFTFEKVDTAVKTVAHWIPATKRSLSDASQVRTLIDTFLTYGLEEEFEDQLISGAGGENFVGLNNTSGIQTQVAPAGAEDVFTVTRMARRKVRIGGRATPTAYVMNPIDWESIELLRDANGNFYGGGPFGTQPNTLWGLPVVESEAVAVGTAWCADWRMGVIWDREQASVQVTDSHADFFIRNLVAVLGEMRAAFGVLRPAAFVKIALA